MIYRICQVWGDGELHELEICDSPEQVSYFLEGADTDGRMRLWGEVLVLDGIARYTPAQWLRSQRVKEVVDGLSPGWHRAEYGNEYVRSLCELNPETWEPLISYTDPVPNTLLSEEFPQDHLEPTGPNWHIRAKVRHFGDDMSDEERAATRERRATERLALQGDDGISLKEAIARLSQQLEERSANQPNSIQETSPAEPSPIPTVQEQLDALEAAQSGEWCPRGGHLPNGRTCVDPL